MNHIDSETSDYTSTCLTLGYSTLPIKYRPNKEAHDGLDILLDAGGVASLVGIPQIAPVLHEVLEIYRFKLSKPIRNIFHDYYVTLVDAICFWASEATRANHQSVTWLRVLVEVCITAYVEITETESVDYNKKKGIAAINDNHIEVIKGPNIGEMVLKTEEVAAAIGCSMEYLLKKINTFSGREDTFYVPPYLSLEDVVCFWTIEFIRGNELATNLVLDLVYTAIVSLLMVSINSKQTTNEKV